MKKFILLSFSLLLFLTGCLPASGDESAPATQVDAVRESGGGVSSDEKCGGGVCDGPETPDNCAEDCPKIEKSPPQTSLIRKGEKDGTYWITNTSSIALLYTQILQPEGSEPGTSPVLVLVPGGVGTIDPQKARILANEGFTVVFFDPDGRGESRGIEDYGGTIHQDGLASVIRAVAQLPEVDETRIGVASFSYGITMATGALSRNPDLPIRFYIDWEGPIDREYTTVGCTRNTMKIDWQPCENDEWWATREAINFIADLQIPYQRLQTEKDHVQPTNAHAIEIVNAAVDGGVPWVRLNDYPANERYDLANPPAMYPENGESTEALMARHAREILAMLE